MDQVEDDMGNPMDMFISSRNCLFPGKKIDQIIPPNSGWSARPARTEGGTSSGLISPWMNSSNQKAERDALVVLLRRGVPPCLRCAVWVTNVHSAVSPDLPKHEVDDFGTLKRVQVFEHGWAIALKSIFPDETDEEDAHMIDFGVGDKNMINLLLTGGPENTPIPEKGAKSLKRVLFAARQSLGIEYCPMLPDLTAQLLTVMEEAYAYATLRKMLEDSSHFFALSRIEHVALCHTFADLLQKIYPQTYDVMKSIGLLVPGALDPIFKRFFFAQLLRPEHIKRIMDLYTLEGIEVIFRFGTALMCLYHAHMTTQAEFNCSDVHSWWDGVRRFAHSRRFKFDVFLEKQVYGVVSGRLIKRSIFPRRGVFQRMLEKNEERAEDGEYDLTDDDLTAYVYNDATLGFVEGETPIVLAKHAAERHALALWLPASLTSTKLEIIYSSSVHGRTLERFYHHCAASKARYTLTLFEILGKDTIIGMFATQTWRPNFVGGDGNCFLFRLRPNPRCFKWANLSHTQATEAPLREGDALAEQPSLSFDSISSVENSPRYFSDQIMVSGNDFISMGIGQDGASGLRVNEDMTRGSSSPAMGMGTGQESLLGDDSQVFDIGLIECYNFVREVDGGVVK